MRIWPMVAIVTFITSSPSRVEWSASSAAREALAAWRATSWAVADISVSGRGHLVVRLNWIMGTGRHLPGDRIQLIAGANQARGTAPQAAEGFGQKVAQGVRRLR